jgi:hypothetical protein
MKLSQGELDRVGVPLQLSCDLMVEVFKSFPSPTSGANTATEPVTPINGPERLSILRLVD